MDLKKRLKKIKLGLNFYIMFFVITFLVELYCFINWSDDYISVIAISIVLLIALYLLMDEIKQYIRVKIEEYDNKIKGENKLLKESVEHTVKEAKNEITEREKASVEILIKAQKNFAEAIIRNQNSNTRK